MCLVKLALIGGGIYAGSKLLSNRDENNSWGNNSWGNNGWTNNHHRRHCHKNHQPDDDQPNGPTMQDFNEKFQNQFPWSNKRSANIDSKPVNANIDNFNGIIKPDEKGGYYYFYPAGKGPLAAKTTNPDLPVYQAQEQGLVNTNNNNYQDEKVYATRAAYTPIASPPIQSQEPVQPSQPKSMEKDDLKTGWFWTSPKPKPAIPQQQQQQQQQQYTNDFQPQPQQAIRRSIPIMSGTPERQRSPVFFDQQQQQGGMGMRPSSVPVYQQQAENGAWR